MKIERKPRISIDIRNIDVGECFEYENGIWLKLQPELINGRNVYKVVSINTYAIAQIDELTSINPLNMKLVEV